MVKRGIGRYQVRKRIRAKARSHESRPPHDRVQLTIIPRARMGSKSIA